MLADVQTNYKTSDERSIGFDLYVKRRPISDCESNEQRRGWREAEAGEKACAILDTAAYLGVNSVEADFVLVREW